MPGFASNERDQVGAGGPKPAEGLMSAVSTSASSLASGSVNEVYDTVSVSYGTLAADPKPPVARPLCNRSAAIRKGARWSILSIALALVIVSGTANLVLYKLVFNAFGEDGAFAVSQIVNVLYVVMGGAVLYPRMWMTDLITPEMKALPQRRFIVMGLLDCFGTFLAAMGSVYTPGQVQTLLNQTLIPATMLVSAVYLRVTFSGPQLWGALLVTLGAGLVVVPSLLNPSLASGQTKGYAVTIYLLSNLPVACSQVYKEKSFKRNQVDVFYLTQWVSVWQLLFGFVLAPLQLLPGVGSPHGVPMRTIIDQTISGTQCWLQTTQDCKDKHTFFLLLGYMVVNFVYNIAGLYVSKHGSAVLNSISFAALLPLTTLAFCFRPLLGRYTERFQVATLLGLVVVSAGLYIYQSPVLEEEVELRRLSIEVGRRLEPEDLAAVKDAAYFEAGLQRDRAIAPTQEGGEGDLLMPQPRRSTDRLLPTPEPWTGFSHVPPRRAPTPVMGEVPSFAVRVVAGLGPILLRPHVIDSPAMNPRTDRNRSRSTGP